MSKYLSKEMLRFLLPSCLISCLAELDKGVFDHVHFYGFNAKQARLQIVLHLEWYSQP